MKRSAACSSSLIVYRCSPYFLPRKIQRRETVQVRFIINFVVLLSVSIHTFCNLIHRAMTLEEQTASTKVALKVKVLLLWRRRRRRRCTVCVCGTALSGGARKAVLTHGLPRSDVHLHMMHYLFCTTTPSSDQLSLDLFAAPPPSLFEEAAEALTRCCN